MNLGSEAVRECVKKIASGGSLTRECEALLAPLLRPDPVGGAQPTSAGPRWPKSCRATPLTPRCAADATQPPVPAAGSR